MRWRWVWFQSRIAACVVSGMIWLTVASLAPAALMVGLLPIVIVSVLGWRPCLMLWCRCGARRVSPGDAAILLRTLVPIAGLRGRNQPRFWVSDRLGWDVRVLDERTLVVSRRLVGWIRDGRVADLAVCEVVVRALALAVVQNSRLVVVVQLFCVPWTALATLARPVSKLARGLRPLAWVFALMAAVDLSRRGELVPIVLLVLVVVATATTPRFDRAWAAHRRAMSEDALRRALPVEVVGPARGGADGLFVVPPLPTKEGGSR